MTTLNFGRNEKMIKTEKKYKSEFNQDVRLHTFNLPAVSACPGAGNCRQFCYALQGRYIFSSVLEPRKENHNIINNIIRSSSNTTEVVDTIANLLIENIKETFGKRLNLQEKNGKKIRNIIRVHDSGDFFHQKYFLGWCKALETLKNDGKNVEAYAYTKSLRIIRPVFDSKPSNLHIIFSVGGIWDNEIDNSLPHSKVFANETEMLEANYVDGSMTDIPAIEGAVKIGLIYHGTKSVSKVKKFLV